MTATRRSGPSEWLPWAFAGLVLLGLIAAVASFLSSSGGHGPDAMNGMHMSDALARGGTSDDGLSPLLSSRLIYAWQLDAIALAVLVLAAAWYLSAVARAQRRGHEWPLGRTLLFLGGLAVCAFATNGSIAVYDMVLFSAHMVGHLLLVMVGPALLVAGRPLELGTRAARNPDRWRRALHSRVVTAVFAPPVALVCYTVVIVGSHLTGAMDVIMQHVWAGQVEHLVYVLVGFQFFALVLGDTPIRWRLASPARWLLLAIAMAVDTFTGIVLLQGTTVIQMTSDPRLHVNALSDTHAGGAIMWLGGDAVMAAVMIVLVLRWLSDPARESGDGWLERTRRAHFAERTATVDAPASPESPQDAAEFDNSDDKLAAYNRWLAGLESHDRR